MRIKIYRYHGQTAITPPTGPTFYVDPNEAREMAAAIINCSNDIEWGKSFYESDFNGVTITDEHGGIEIGDETDDVWVPNVTADTSWDVFGDRIECDDELAGLGGFEDDGAAWAHVLRRALDGSARELSALFDDISVGEFNDIVCHAIGAPCGWQMRKHPDITARCAL